MFNLVQSIPSYLVPFILFFIVLPSILAVIIRLSLHHDIKKITQNINNPTSSQSSKISKIKEAFKKASTRLESTNTLALLETFYNQEKLFGLRYDQLDYFCKSLPNLLIAFGLLGTFFGITLNLSSIGTIINQNGAESNFIVGNLKDPLESMGIAFFSSLIAILFSSVLTIFNLIFNTELAKNNLFFLLENYLDNNYSEPESNLEIKINRIINSEIKGVLNTVLYSQNDGYQNFSQSLESLLIRVFKEALNPLSESVIDFKESVTSFKDQVEIATRSSDSIKESFEKLEKGANTFKQASVDIQSASIEIQKHQYNLWEWRNKLADTQQAFAESTQDFSGNIKRLIDNNREATNLAERIYSQLGLSAESFETSSNRFLQASEAIRKSQFSDNLLNASQSLARFSESANILNQSTQDIQIIFNYLQNSVNQMVGFGEDIKKSNQKSEEILTNLLNLMGIAQKHQKQSIQVLYKIGQVIASNSSSLQGISQNISVYARSLDETKIVLEILTHNIEQIENRSDSRLQIFSKSTDEITLLQQELIQVIQQMTSEIEEIRNIHSALSRLIELLKNYPENFNIEPQMIELGDRLVVSFSKPLRFNALALNEINAKVAKLLDLANRSLNIPKDQEKNNSD